MGRKKDFIDDHEAIKDLDNILKDELMEMHDEYLFESGCMHE